MKYIIYCIVYVCLSVTRVYAQAIDNTISYKHIGSQKYVRLNYENDFFTKTDEYYTQGIHLELVEPVLAKNPLIFLLPRPANWQTQYGLGIEHNGYTPTNTDHNYILYGDRPFAGCFFLKSFQISIDSQHNQSFSSSISTGVIGPLAGAGQMQRDIHKWLGNYIPNGWDNQVQNDIIINYQSSYEKQLWHLANYASLSANVMGRIGTLNTKASLGTTLMAGYMQLPFRMYENIGKYHIFFYDHPEISAIGYDATLQGGVLQRGSPYVITDKDIERITLQNRWGVVLQLNRLWLEYFQTVLTPEFKGEKYHRWGGIQIALTL